MWCPRWCLGSTKKLAYINYFSQLTLFQLCVVSLHFILLASLSTYFDHFFPMFLPFGPLFFFFWFFNACSYLLFFPSIFFFPSVLTSPFQPFTFSLIYIMGFPVVPASFGGGVISSWKIVIATLLFILVNITFFHNCILWKPSVKWCNLLS